MVMRNRGCVLRISTSGNSKNIMYAATVEHAKGMKVIGLTGQKIVRYLELPMYV